MTSVLHPLSSALDAFANGITADSLQIEQIKALIAKDNTRCIYVLRRPSALEESLLLRFARRAHLPSLPNGGLENGGLENGGMADGETEELSAEFTHLRGFSGLEISLGAVQRHRARVIGTFEQLIEQSSTENILLIPVTLLAGRGPQPWPTECPWPVNIPLLSLGEIWRAAVLIAYRSTLRFELGPALRVHPTHTPQLLLSQLSLALYRQEKVARGAPTQERQKVENIVLSGAAFEELIRNLSAETGLSRDELIRRARRFFGHTAGTMRRWAIWLLYIVLDRLIPRLFRVELRGVERLRSRIERHPVILLPAHRSHFDYLVMSYALYHANLPLPYIAAGDNLNFFPVGQVLRAAGGFFIRRKNDGDPLYRLILERYLTYLVKQGHLLEFYIEGGRSRTGMILPPKLGLLKYLIHCFREGERSDLCFIPVGISYERVPELNALVGELAGKKKKRENFLQLVRFRLLLRRKFGELMISFGDPVSLKQFAQLPRTKPHVESTAARALTEDLGFQTIRDIQSQLVVTQRALGSAAILIAGISSTQLKSDQRNDVDAREALLASMLSLLRTMAFAVGIDEALNWTLDAPLAGLPDREDPSTAQMFALPLNQGLTEALSLKTARAAFTRLLENGHFIQDDSEANETRSEPPGAHELSYQALQLLHIIASPSLIGLAALAPNREALHILHQLFKPLLLLPHWSQWADGQRPLLDRLARAGWISITATSELKSPPEFKILDKGHELIPPARLLLPYILGLRAGLFLCQDRSREGHQSYSRMVLEDFSSIFTREVQALCQNESEAALVATTHLRGFVLDAVRRQLRTPFTDETAEKLRMLIELLDLCIASIPRGSYASGSAVRGPG